MTADLLRRAAQRIRDTATGTTDESWQIWHDLDAQGFYTVGNEAGVLDETHPTHPEADVDNPVAHVYTGPDAAHIALWDPPVALAVADVLDDAAKRWTRVVTWDPDDPRAYPLEPEQAERAFAQWLTLARRVLGEESK